MNESINAIAHASIKREAEKTPAERAEDVAYTLNHAISCATNDMVIAPTISALFGIQVGCADPSHDHGTPAISSAQHEPHEHIPFKGKWKNYRELPEAPQHAEPLQIVTHAPHTHKTSFSWKLYRSEALHYLKGEIIGDIVAVPLTIGVQRFLPSAMDGIRQLVEPVAAPFFRKGANTAAKKWGASVGLADDAPEIVARAEKMYRSEMNHLPQAIMWNLFAFPIGVVTQKMGGHGSSYGRIIRNKSIGAVISNTFLLGSRALAPNVAQQWDAMNSRHIIAPITQAASSLLGIQQKEIPAATPSNWAIRVERTEADNGMTRAP